MIPESSMIRVYHTIHRSYIAGRPGSEATDLFRKLFPALAYTNQELVTSVAFFKCLLVRKRIFRTETMRIPGFKWDAFNRRIADELICVYLSLEATLYKGGFS